MVSTVLALRAVNTDDEAQFGKLMKTVLSPSEPLESQEQLRGRDDQLTEIRRALYASGRHVFIHGFRGVGKTSLAQTAAHQLQSSDAPPIVLGCSSGTETSLRRLWAVIRALLKQQNSTASPLEPTVSVLPLRSLSRRDVCPCRPALTRPSAFWRSLARSTRRRRLLLSTSLTRKRR
jgi:hypothetical protein